jgi:hypothetical protein
MDENKQDEPTLAPDGRQVVRIRTDATSGADGPPTEGRSTRRLGRLPQHANGPFEPTGPDRRRGTGGRLLPRVLTMLGLIAVVWGALVLTGTL